MYQITYFSAAQGRLIQAGAVEGQNLIERLADLQKEDIRPTEITLDGNECALINRILTEINPALMVYDAFIHDHGFVVLRGYFVGLLSNLAEQLQNGAASIGRARDFQDGGQLQADLDGRLKRLPVLKARALGRSIATCGWCEKTKDQSFYDVKNLFTCSDCFSRANQLQTAVDQTRAVEFMDSITGLISTEFNAEHVLETFETDVQFQKLQTEAVPGRQWVNPNEYPFYVPFNGQAVEWVELDGSAAAGNFDGKFTNHFIKFPTEEGKPGQSVRKESILKWRVL